MLLVMITTIFVWEWSKRAAGGVKKAVRMRMFAPSARLGLSKGEGKELLALLSVEDRSVEQEARLSALIGKFQAHEKGALRDSGAAAASGSGSGSRGRTTATSPTTRPGVPSRERFQHGAEEFRLILRSRRMCRQGRYTCLRLMPGSGILCSRGKGTCTSVPTVTEFT